MSADASCRFRIRGVRGSFPAFGPDFLRYGGHTTCFSLETPEGLIVIDAGTGLTQVEADRPTAPPALPIHVLFTHFHIDHLVGLPGFAPLYRAGQPVTLWGDAERQPRWESAVRTLFAPPYWPMDMARLPARVAMRDLPADAALDLLGVRISWCPVLHPQTCLAYRLQTPSASIVIATDHECGDAALDARFLEFCRHADFLVYDAQYTPEEYARHRGWGHSTWKDGAAIARQAGVGELVLTHHDRRRTDPEIDSVVAQARAVFPRTRAASDGLALVG
jgi:phosphoribosyl 1,2-cyclic phosphodiesterase